MALPASFLIGVEMALKLNNSDIPSLKQNISRIEDWLLMVPNLTWELILIISKKKKSLFHLVQMPVNLKEQQENTSIAGTSKLAYAITETVRW